MKDSADMEWEHRAGMWCAGVVFWGMVLVLGGMLVSCVIHWDEHPYVREPRWR